MIFLHSSLNTEKFENNKKLNLLKKGIIDIVQFVNLITSSDPYILFGPAVIDKDKINEFITEWKANQLNIESVQFSEIDNMSYDDFINRFDLIKKIYPEVEPLISEYYEKLRDAPCHKCVKRQYLTYLALKIQKLNDGRDLMNEDHFFDLLIKKFTLLENDNDTPYYTDFDSNWIKPDELVGIGNDLVKNISSCFECVIKHIGRAKILYEEMILGYPDYKELMINELVEGNKNIEKFYLKYLDSLSQLDMGSSELIGDVKSLNKEFAGDIIELANEIRIQRITFQNDISKTPDFDGLRLKVKKLELKINDLNK